MERPEKPTRTNAQASVCHGCMGGYADGKQDCENLVCPIYTWMPYRKLEPDLSWMEFNPAKKGYVKWEDCGRELTDAQRAEAVERMKKIREKIGKKKNKTL